MGGTRFVQETTLKRGRLAQGILVVVLGALALGGCDASYPSTDWENPSYDHAALSGGFQLLGTHADAPCTGCHASTNYAPLFQPADGNDCVACHRADYEAQHASQGYPTTCTLCHTPTVWSDGAFDHADLSGGFNLLQVHGGLPCTACHDAETFAPLFEPVDASDCATCHSGDFPDAHQSRGYPENCTFCHTPTAWQNGVFDHATLSGGFELLGIHVNLKCTYCHDGETWEVEQNPEGPTDCVACHQYRYEDAHGGSGYPTTCIACHTPTTWSDVSFDHPLVANGFELLGVHDELACSACHEAGTFEPIFQPEDANDCVACHQADYDAQHQGTGFPLTCTSCHTPTSWSGGTFDHSAVSGGFQLVGVHRETACTGCHNPDGFTPIFDPVDETDCLACHQEEYDSQHAADGYPTDCSFCHTPTRWSDGSFDHAAASGGFSLLGIHAEAPCLSCHDAETFAPLFTPADETDCVSCHQAQYDAQHSTDGYPTDCTYCHTPTTWANNTFDHDGDYFPIFTGEHSTRWSTCATCHTNPDDFSVFTCFTCHAHNQISMDNRHSGFAGYAYVPSACVSCHPDGTADD